MTIALATSGHGSCPKRFGWDNRDGSLTAVNSVRGEKIELWTALEFMTRSLMNLLGIQVPPRDSELTRMPGMEKPLGNLYVIILEWESHIFSLPPLFFHKAIYL